MIPLYLLYKKFSSCKNYYSKTISIIFFIVLISFPLSVPSQIPEKSSNGNFKNNPFQIGAEMGGSLPFDRDESYPAFGLLGFLDINIYEKIAFLKFEIGYLEIENSSDNNRFYVSGGYNTTLVKFKEDRIYLHFGIALAKSFPFFFGSLKYLYSINKISGVTLSVKYPFGSTKNPFLSIGIQLFKN